jgi:hypothetical protein
VKRRDWKTRTRGTRKQIGKKFPVEEVSAQAKKLKLPKLRGMGVKGANYEVIFKDGVRVRVKAPKPEIAVAKAQARYKKGEVEKVSFIGRSVKAGETISKVHLSSTDIPKEFRELASGHDFERASSEWDNFWSEGQKATFLKVHGYSMANIRKDFDSLPEGARLELAMRIAEEKTENPCPPKKAGNPRSKSRKTMFFSAKSPKYAEIVSLKSPEKAKVSAKKLLAEFRKSKTRDKRRRVKRVTVLASNRAQASSKRKKLSPNERRQFWHIAEIYRDAANNMEID